MTKLRPFAGATVSISSYHVTTDTATANTCKSATSVTCINKAKLFHTPKHTYMRNVFGCLGNLEEGVQKEKLQDTACQVTALHCRIENSDAKQGH